MVPHSPNFTLFIVNYIYKYHVHVNVSKLVIYNNETEYEMSLSI